MYGVYTEDSVRLSPTMEELGRRVTEWRVDKRIKVNVAESKVMVDGRIIVLRKIALYSSV